MLTESAGLLKVDSFLSVIIKGLFWLFLIEEVIQLYLGQVLFQNYMWPTLEIHVQRKAASTNTTASMLLNVAGTAEGEGLVAL